MRPELHRLPTPPRPPESLTVRLRSDQLELVVIPGKGGDVDALIDRASGVDVLFTAPWGWRDPALMPTPQDEAGWLDRYAGGWQLLLPNAGPPREIAGARQGYHGEASVVPWAVLDCSSSRLRLGVHLTSAPLYLARTYELLGGELRIETEILNLSRAEVPVSWVEHPAFGADFVDQHSTLDSGARSLLADSDDPGAVLRPGALSALPSAITRDGGTVDLRALPGRQAARKVFAALTDFDTGWYTISSPTRGFGLRMEWDAAVLPHAWLWQECSATTGWPWFGRAYAIAVEPANVLPGSGRSSGLVRGHSPLLPPLDELRSEVRLSRFDLPVGASG